jgi:hypothetical protein
MMKKVNGLRTCWGFLLSKIREGGDKVYGIGIGFMFCGALFADSDSLSITILLELVAIITIFLKKFQEYKDMEGDI